MKPQTTREKKRHSLFMRRTLSVFNNMKARHKKVYPKADNIDGIDLEQIRVIVQSAIRGRACRYCGEGITEKNFSIDHLTPLERGGEWRLRNLQVITKGCNTAKGRLTHEEFSRLMSVLREFPPEVMREVLGRLKAGASVIRLQFLGRKKG